MDPALLLVTNLNDWSPSEDKTFVPHGSNGPIFRGQDFANGDVGGVPSVALGAHGGNLGRVDGSVEWKSIRQMRVYSGSLVWGGNGCQALW